MKYFLLLLFLLLNISKTLNAQESDSLNLVTIITHNKQHLVGELLNITSDSIFVRNDEFGSLSFGKKNIKSIQEGIISPHFSGTPNSSVPYYIQSARPNGRGNHYYKNYYIFGNEFNFGLTDRLNFSAGFEFATIIYDRGDNFPLIQIGAKYCARVTNKFHAGISAKYYFNNVGSIKMISIPLTLGGKRTNITISPVYIHEGSSKLIGIFSNLALSISSKSRFLIDFAHVDNESVFAPNFEYMFKRGFTLSIGGFFISDGAIPSLSFSVPFGSWKNTYKK